MHTIDQKQPLIFLPHGHAYLCCVGSWTHLYIRFFNHGARGGPSAYLGVIGRAVCGDKDMAALAKIWPQNLLLQSHFPIWVYFLRQFSEIDI